MLKTSSCKKCGVVDNEIHRINDCILYRKTNKYDKQDKFDYALVYSDKPEEIRKAAEAILDVWDLGKGKNTIKGGSRRAEKSRKVLMMMKAAKLNLAVPGAGQKQGRSGPGAKQEQGSSRGGSKAGTGQELS